MKSIILVAAALVASVTAAPGYAPAPAAEYNAAAPAQTTPCTKSLATAAPVATNAYDAAKPVDVAPKPTAAAYDAAAPAPAATTPCDKSKTAAAAVTQAAYDAPAVQENPYSDVTKKTYADDRDRLVTTGETIMRERFESSAMPKSSSSFVAVVAVVGAGALLF
ncbi:hypothetical protein BCR44DRAFT_69670 [Catenaria anguillulae PL171]|uniref:Uncharacterized protein n=1 Tax=Catenaria anguillulae PL171 TaxID=765915 RepID=A0A1Y2HYM2_9FUNG|nr:hypothetical protein BCR44DRAFT_69670 [Catenaria anguillulae PL171]